MRRTFIARFTIEGEPEDNDALVEDLSDARTGMATWLECAIPAADNTTVWSSTEDFIRDLQDEGVLTTTINVEEPAS